MGGWGHPHCLGTPNLATELVASPLRVTHVDTVSESPVESLAGSLWLLYFLFILCSSHGFYLPTIHPLIISTLGTRKIYSRIYDCSCPPPSRPKVGREMCHLFPVALRPGLGLPSLSFLPGVMKGSLCPPANVPGCL